MQVQIAGKKERGALHVERDYMIQVKTRPNYCGILALTLSAVILLGMLAVEWLPSRL